MFLPAGNASLESSAIYLEILLGVGSPLHRKIQTALQIKYVFLPGNRFDFFLHNRDRFFKDIYPMKRLMFYNSIGSSGNACFDSLQRALTSQEFISLQPHQILRLVEAMQLLCCCVGVLPKSALVVAESLLHSICIHTNAPEESAANSSVEGSRFGASLVAAREWLIFVKSNRVGTMKSLAIATIRNQLQSNIPAKVTLLNGMIPERFKKMILSDDIFHASGPVGLETALRIAYSSFIDEDALSLSVEAPF